MKGTCELKRLEFSKIIVAWLIINGTVWTYLSYILAWFGKAEIAEALSKAVVVEILGVVAVYSLKALFGNLSKNNAFQDKVKCKKSEEENSL